MFQEKNGLTMAVRMCLIYSSEAVINWAKKVDTQVIIDVKL